MGFSKLGIRARKCMVTMLRLRINKMMCILVKFLVTTLKRWEWIFWGRSEAGKVSRLFCRGYRQCGEHGGVVCPAETCWNRWFQGFGGKNGWFFNIFVFFRQIGRRWVHFWGCNDGGMCWGLRRWQRFKNGAWKRAFFVSNACWGVWILWWAGTCRESRRL